jgi:hypothetical protein
MPSPITPEIEIQLLENLLSDDCPITRRILEIHYELLRKDIKREATISE